MELPVDSKGKNPILINPKAMKLSSSTG